MRDMSNNYIRKLKGGLAPRVAVRCMVPSPRVNLPVGPDPFRKDNITINPNSDGWEPLGNGRQKRRHGIE